MSSTDCSITRAAWSLTSIIPIPGAFLGEQQNALRRAVFFNRLGEIRDRSYENQRHRASGLNLGGRCDHALEYGLPGTGDRTADKITSVQPGLAPVCFS